MTHTLRGHIATAKAIIDELEGTLRHADKGDGTVDTGDLWTYHTQLSDELGSIEDFVENLVDTIGT
jgi:hypothetical protein